MLIELKVQVRNSEGFHLRPITKLAQLARNFDGDITLYYKENQASAKSIMSMMSLAIPCGEEILFHIQGKEAQQIVEAIIDVFLPQPREEW
ncbi:MAG: HPr family phosphocarrier protein [Planctomycetota bacterium]